LKLTATDFPLPLRGRLFTPTELRLIQHLTEALQTTTRAAISREVCRQLGWYCSNGQLKDAACRYVLLRLHENGLICLPAPKRNPFDQAKIVFTAQTAPQAPITQNAGALKPVRLELVTARNQLTLWKEYVQRYHYLGHKVIVGPQLKYFIAGSAGRLGCIAFGGAAWSVKPRDQWLGWTPRQRQENLHLIINNVRFLIFPWVQSKNLASLILALASKIVPQQWQGQYGYQPRLLETFVDKERFHGTCYQAANWIYVGDTTGRGKTDRFKKFPTTIKKILLYPLDPNFCGAFKA